MKINDKQGRTVVHLEIAGHHYYYGNLKTLTGDFPKEKIGVSYNYLKNYNISQDKPCKNDKCIIRKGILITSQKKSNKEILY